MGARFSGTILKSDNQQDAEKEFYQIQHDCRYDHGHSGYTGTLAEARGIEFTKMTFKTRREAAEWIEDNAEKWGPALAVKIEGKPGWVCGAICSE